MCRASGDLTGELHALAEMCDLPNADFAEISRAANRFNAALAEQGVILDYEVRQILARRIESVMERRISEANATDCSRLAWLLLRLKDETKAVQFTRFGLSKDPDNDYCLGLANKLSIH